MGTGDEGVPLRTVRNRDVRVEAIENYQPKKIIEEGLSLLRRKSRGKIAVHAVILTLFTDYPQIETRLTLY